MNDGLENDIRKGRWHGTGNLVKAVIGNTAGFETKQSPSMRIADKVTLPHG